MDFKTFNHIYGPIVWLDLHNNVFNYVITWHENLWYSDDVELKKFFRWELAESLSTNHPASFNATNPPVK